MSSEKNKQEKARLHPRNKNRERYDLSALITATPELKKHVSPNKFGNDSVDFSNPIAVKLLNKALLSHYYGVESWEFPDENLCPPIPGRADYIHYMADLLCENNFGTIPTGDKITCLDVGLGASCIYPIVGVTEYQWNFIGSDINPLSIESAQNIVNSNSPLKGKVECRLQNNPKNIFQGILSKADKVDLTICNPPFHSSFEEAQKGTARKTKNLSGKKVNSAELDLAGISKELVYDGGEYRFIQNMKGIYQLLERAEALQIKMIPLGTGNKSSRIVTWTFLSREERKEWKETRWKK
jgi:23S rRNA (adenine1618-N6)-methyltransferase